MTVGELRKALEGVAADTKVIIRGTSNNGLFRLLGHRLSFGSSWGEGRAGPF